MGVALGKDLKFYTSVAKGLKIKVRMFWGLIPTFVKVIGKKLVGEALLTAHPFLNRANVTIFLSVSYDLHDECFFSKIYGVQMYDFLNKTFYTPHIKLGK